MNLEQLIFTWNGRYLVLALFASKHFLTLTEFYLSFMYTFCKCFVANCKTVLNLLLLFPFWYQKTVFKKELGQRFLLQNL